MYLKLCLISKYYQQLRPVLMLIQPNITDNLCDQSKSTTLITCIRNNKKNRNIEWRSKPPLPLTVKYITIVHSLNHNYCILSQKSLKLYFVRCENWDSWWRLHINRSSDKTRYLQFKYDSFGRICISSLMFFFGFFLFERPKRQFLSLYNLHICKSEKHMLFVMRFSSGH